MRTMSAERTITADQDRVRSILLDISKLADWNPALVRVDTQDRVAVVGTRYPVSTRIPGDAGLTYTQATSDHVQWRLTVAGSIEVGDWFIEADGAQVRVTHEISHTGAVFTLMQHAMRPIAGWRLDRLVERASSRSMDAP